MERRAHWEDVYRARAPDEVSWYQPHAGRSIELIEGLVPDREASILDVGGGASTLVDDLLSRGFSNLTVLDVSGAALARAQARLGRSAPRVRWIEADMLEAALPKASADVWHDRAAFHFLTSQRDRRRYVAQARRTVKPGGYVIVAAFAEDGPARCSGLDVQRYSPASLQAALGSGFELIERSREAHITPAGKEQAFLYCVFQVKGDY